MSEIGAFEAKNTLSALLDRVEKGEEIVITRRGTPVAKLVPARPGINREKARAAAEGLKKLQAKLALKNPALTWEEIKQMRDEGRR
jgi:prevent-host-death family protein